MPTVKPGVKVLVTGANGYLAMWIVRTLLERGYSVRGTVRSASKGTYLTEYFKGYGDRFEIYIVPDITAEGAFDESLVGVSAVLHVASPLPNAKLEDPQEYITPAVEGTLSILRSSLNATNVKRVIYTSTTGTILISDTLTEPTMLTENDWNIEAVKSVEGGGKNASIRHKYIASKVIAEKAAWDLYEKNKNTSPYDFLTIHPPWIFGPPIHELGNDPSSLGASLAPWYELCVSNAMEKLRTQDVLEESNGSASEDSVLAVSNGWADVRDLADAHVTALEKEEVAGERIQVVESNASWQEWIDALQKVQPSVPLTHALPTGKPGLPPKLRDIYVTTKEARLLGVNYRHIHETAKDTLEFISKKGW